MDIQLFATDKELREFPENKTDSEDNTDPDTTSSPNNIDLTASDLPISHTDLPKSPSSLPISKAKCRCRTKRGHRSLKTRLTLKTIPTLTQLLILITST